MTDYYNNQVQLEFGPVTMRFDLVPDHFLVDWVLDTSDTSVSYSYACNYTVFVQAVFYNSMSADTVSKYENTETLHEAMNRGRDRSITINVGLQGHTSA